MKVQGKIDLAICGAFVVGLGLASLGAYSILSKDAIAESVQDARIMMEAATAIRNYTANSISPLLKERMQVEFLPYAIPSFAAQTNFGLVQQKLPEYTYREPTLNPTNTRDQAEGWETDIVNDFRDHPGKPELQLVRDTPAGRFLTMARPLKVGSPVCLTCHSTPAKAPPTMIALYGDQHGFGWKLGEVVAAQVVSIPLSVPLDRAYRALWLFVVGLAATFAIVILVVNLLLRFIVVKPVRQISAMASEVSLGKLDAPELHIDRNDEIGSLAGSFNRMRRSLQDALRMLERNT